VFREIDAYPGRCSLALPERSTESQSKSIDLHSGEASVSSFKAGSVYRALASKTTNVEFWKIDHFAACNSKKSQIQANSAIEPSFRRLLWTMTPLHRAILYIQSAPRTSAKRQFN
jgi:hypothetical protein